MGGFSSTDGLSVTTWGTYPPHVNPDEGGQQLWKATKDDRTAYFTAPRDTGIATLSALATVLLGLSLGPNTLDVLEAFPLTPDGVTTPSKRP